MSVRAMFPAQTSKVCSQNFGYDLVNVFMYQSPSNPSMMVEYRDFDRDIVSSRRLDTS